MKSLSIITVNLNNFAGLEKTLHSVGGQTFCNFEHIVIDGASTDGSVEIIKTYSESAKCRVKWLSEPDTGIYNAMNKGIRMAEGEYCLFLNSGDYFADGDVVKKVFSIVFNEDVVYGFYQFDYGNRFEIAYSPKELTFRTFVKGTIHHSGNSFIRRDAFDRWGLYDEKLKIVSDWKWFLQAIGLGFATTRYIDVMLSVFNTEGISKTNPMLLNKERRQVLEECLPPAVLYDCDRYYFWMDQIDRFRRHHIYWLVYFIDRVLFKLEKWRILR